MCLEVAEVPPDLLQFGAGAVTDGVVVVEDTVDALSQFGVVMDLLAEPGNRLISCGFTVGQEGVHLGRNTQKFTQYCEVIGGQHSIYGTDAPENFAGTIEACPWQIDIVLA